MLCLYDNEDRDLTADTYVSRTFKDRTLVMMVYARTDTFDKTQMQNWVLAHDSVEGSRVCNHYVPHNRILRAIEITIIGMTREEAINWLNNAVSILNIEPDVYLKNLVGSPLMSRPAYDAWADWAIGSICDWRQNMFYGAGSGDKGGTSLDVPMRISQRKRVEKAALVLKSLFDEGVLSLTALMPKEKTDTEKEDSDEEDEMPILDTRIIWYKELNKAMSNSDNIKTDPTYELPQEIQSKLKFVTRDEYLTRANMKKKIKV